MKIYLKILAGLYLIGGFLHILDLFDLRLQFSQMPTIWKIWIVYLTIFDLTASVGLWQQKNWGIFLFAIVALSQLVAYLGFMDYFGAQYPLIGFHLISLLLYFFFRQKTNGPSTYMGLNSN